MWWQQQEKGGRALLGLTMFLVRLLPEILLRPIVAAVSFVYYLSCKNERENIKFYLSLLHARGVKTGGAFLNFYNFAMSICDKFRVWLGKFELKKIDVSRIESFKDEFKAEGRGRILLVSHMGNIDVARALAQQQAWLDITILVYAKHAAEFFKIRSKLDAGVKIFEVGELDVAAMMQLKSIIDAGGCIGVMGDRVPLSGGKSVKVPFLGRECEFPIGAFVLAFLLKTKISSLWAIKKGSGYELDITHIANSVELGRERAQSARKYVEIYVQEFERRCEAKPHQFFNFYDFWQVRDDKI